MKVFTMHCIFMLACMISASGETDDKWSAGILKRIDEIAAEPTEDDILFLCHIAAVQQKDAIRANVAGLATERLQAVPGFPEVMMDHIQSERAKWKSGGLEEPYNSYRQVVIKAMGHIPDPNVVKLLGRLLFDMEWTTDPLESIMRGDDYTLPQPNGMLAALSLAELIKEPPVAKRSDNYIERDVRTWQTWWREIESGERKFCFKGQKVEYRVKPDGTWETLAMAHSQDDGPRITKAGNATAKRPEKRPQASPVAQITSGSNRPWIVGAGALLAAAFFWLWRKAAAR